MSTAGFARHRDAVAQGRFIRVVNWHNTPAADRDKLTGELRWLRERFVPVGLAELDGFFATGRWASPQPGFIPVFYEGYRNSAEVAAPVCDDLGIAAWFLICTAFVETPIAQQEAFARSHYIGVLDEDMARSGERIALSWDEIAELSTRHVVTPHTAAHLGINDTPTDEDLEREVVQPKRLMDAVTGQSAPAFAWLHGSHWGMSERHDKAVRDAGYRYLISNTSLHKIA